MLFWLFTLFVFLHGLVFLLYPAFALNWFPPPSGAEFAGKSWLLSGFLGERTIRQLTTIVFFLVIALFVVSALGLVFRQGWSLSLLTAAIALSSLALLVFWDGKFAALDEKGIFGLLINAALLAVLYLLRFPSL